MKTKEEELLEIIEREQKQVQGNHNQGLSEAEIELVKLRVKQRK